MSGGLGSDAYFVDNAGDAVTENANAGNDTVYASIDYTLAPDVEYLVLQGNANLSGSGNSLSNSISGNAGNNILNGGADINSMYGGAGNDRYFVDNAGDVVVENSGEGIDSVIASAHYALTANVENLTLQGDAATALQGYGNELANILTGSDGVNLLNGRGGADIMVGGTRQRCVLRGRSRRSGDRKPRRGHRRDLLHRQSSAGDERGNPGAAGNRQPLW